MRRPPKHPAMPRGTRHFGWKSRRLWRRFGLCWGCTDNRLDPITRVMKMLLEALACAEDISCSPWEFAVPYRDIVKTGIVETEFRRLVVEDVVEHRHRHQPAKSGNADEGIGLRWRFYPSSHFILSNPYGVNYAKTLVGVDDLQCMLINYEKELANLGTPRWDAVNRELWVGDELVKRLDRRATKQMLILDQFAKHGWPETVANPFLNRPNANVGQLYSTLQNLNRNQLMCSVRFGSRKGGNAIGWEIVKH